MSNILPGDGRRDKYVKDSGNNDNDGSNITFSVADLPTVRDRVLSQDPPPGLFNPSSIIDVGASRYELSETFDIPDNVQGALRFSTIATGSGWSAGALVQNRNAP